MAAHVTSAVGFLCCTLLSWPDAATISHRTQAPQVFSHSAGAELSISEFGRHWPCAALALLSLRGSGPLREGILYYSGFPTSETVEMTLGEADQAQIRQSLGFLRFNPYSPQGGAVVSVRWTVRHLGDDALLVTVESEILDGTGHSLAPREIVEPRSVVILSENMTRIRIFQVDSTPDQAFGGDPLTIE